MGVLQGESTVRGKGTVPESTGESQWAGGQAGKQGECGTLGLQTGCRSGNKQDQRWRAQQGENLMELQTGVETQKGNMEAQLPPKIAGRTGREWNAALVLKPSC